MSKTSTPVVAHTSPRVEDRTSSSTGAGLTGHDKSTPDLLLVCSPTIIIKRLPTNRFQIWPSSLPLIFLYCLVVLKKRKWVQPCTGPRNALVNHYILRIYSSPGAALPPAVSRNGKGLELIPRSTHSCLVADKDTTKPCCLQTDH